MNVLADDGGLLKLDVVEGTDDEVVEHGLGHLPFTEKQVVTPTGMSGRCGDDCKAHKVIVKGKQADPLKVLERVQKKSHRQVELLSPIPKPPSPEEEKKAEEEKPKLEEEKKEEVMID
ncbi:hypothetical protein Sjap_007503 [Stephania japonica]|uniref:Uncharacterized protein n=1 Tax=Stephania japonica TaxID=461633 RepID=A0AAP0JNC0_9MAGN